MVKLYNISEKCQQEKKKNISDILTNIYDILTNLFFCLFLRNSIPGNFQGLKYQQLSRKFRPYHLPAEKIGEIFQPQLAKIKNTGIL